MKPKEYMAKIDDALITGRNKTLDELGKWVINFGKNNLEKRCSFCLGAVLKRIHEMRQKK